MLVFKAGTTNYSVDLDNPLDISIPLDFHGDQPSVYGVPKASAQAYEDGSFVGDTRRGGSCNFEHYTLVPHCNGTHTECLGHITNARISVNSILRDFLLPAALISVEPEGAIRATETSYPKPHSSDFLLTRGRLHEAVATVPEEFLTALAIRTLPNADDKMRREYSDPPPPYFSIQATEFLNELKVQHLLVDTPSVDRTFDGGNLTAHHRFWGIRKGKHELDPNRVSSKTITEMIYVPDEVADGIYLLNLQLPAFVADAAPSRPVLYKLNPLAESQRSKGHGRL